LQLTGIAEFNEVFLDDARAPAQWVIGEVDGGWSMAVALLAHERVATGTGSIARSENVRSKTGRMPVPVRQLVELARDRGATEDPLVRQALARLFTSEQLMAWLGGAGAHPSIGKLWRTGQGRGAADLAHRLARTGGAAWQEDDMERDCFAYHVLNCRGMSIGGGTDEMQRKTLAEKVLGLPRDPA
jgi:alkylation response protein AidB-like acyl-CoA dehydrogenase